MIGHFRASTRVIGLVTGLCGVCVLAASLTIRFLPNQRSDPPPPHLTVAEPQRDLGTLICGQEHVVKFRIINPCDEPRRVLGSTSCCVASGCFFPVEHGPIIVPAKGEIAFACTIDLREAGPFEIPMMIYLEDKGVNEVLLTVRGNGVAADR